MLIRNRLHFVCQMEINVFEGNMADVQKVKPEIDKGQTCLGSKQWTSPFNDVRWSERRSQGGAKPDHRNVLT